MKKNAKLYPCYYWDWFNLICYKTITYKESLDYGERLFCLGFSLVYINWKYVIFKNWVHVNECKL